MKPLPRRVGTALALTAMAVLTLGGCNNSSDDAATDETEERTEVETRIEPVEEDSGTSDGGGEQSDENDDAAVAPDGADAGASSLLGAGVLRDGLTKLSPEALHQEILDFLAAQGSVECESPGGLSAGEWTTCTVELVDDGDPVMHPSVEEADVLDVAIVKSVNGQALLVVRYAQEPDQGLDEVLDLNAVYTVASLGLTSTQKPSELDSELVSESIVGGLKEAKSGEGTTATCENLGDSQYECTVEAANADAGAGTWTGTAYMGLFPPSTDILFKQN